VSFAAITICVAPQRVFVVDLFMESVRKLLDTASYVNLRDYGSRTQSFDPVCTQTGDTRPPPIFTTFLNVNLHFLSGFTKWQFPRTFLQQNFACIPCLLHHRYMQVILTSQISISKQQAYYMTLFLDIKTLKMLSVICWESLSSLTCATLL
jgi:hypothetical protein